MRKVIEMTASVISITFFIVYLQFLEYDKRYYEVKVGEPGWPKHILR